MCGITGLVFKSSEINVDRARSVVSSMLDRIQHRGPDGTGVWVSPEKTVVLGHKRLAIIDLSDSASQPMVNSNNNISIVFNGEIYNHRELRNELENNGVTFKTDHSDTEVLLNGYIYWGLNKLLNKINGMFAFAIYDCKIMKLHLCRDRLGIKCLYFSRFKGKFIFSSEIKGILSARFFAPELDRSKLNEYLLYRSLPAPYTLFKNINKVEAGTYLTLDVNSLEYDVSKYWNPLDVNIDDSIKSQRDVEEKLSTLIDSSLDYRLESDVSVGLFLSGGVDSSFLLSRLSTKVGSIKCFTASFPENSVYDESLDAKRMAKKFDAEYIDVPIKSTNYIDILEKVVYYQEEPISAPVCVPIYYLSEAARQYDVPVVLAGEGSDEIFIGYENWLKLRQAQQYINRHPMLSNLLSVARPVAKRFLNPTSPVHDILYRASKKGYPIFWGGAMDLNGDVRSKLLGGELSSDALNDTIFEECVSKNWQDFKSKRSGNDISSWMSYMDIKLRLPELMLPRLDRMGMAHSIEGRVPYLDHRIVELMFSVAENVSMESRKIGKPALKKIASPSLGREFVYRNKQGFQAPVSEWKTQGFAEYVNLLKLFSVRTGLFDADAVNEIVKFGGRRYFSLINFMLWYLIYIEHVLKDELPNLKRWHEY